MKRYLKRTFPRMDNSIVIFDREKNESTAEPTPFEHPNELWKRYVVWLSEGNTPDEETI